MTSSILGLFWTLVFISIAKFSSAQNTVYRPADDASWAIQSQRLSTMLGEDKQKLYDEFIGACNGIHRHCANDDLHRLKMNRLQPPSV